VVLPVAPSITVAVTPGAARCGAEHCVADADERGAHGDVLVDTGALGGCEQSQRGCVVVGCGLSRLWHWVISLVRSGG
jgi:hypothetical protein